MFRIVHPLLHYYSNKEDGALPIGFQTYKKEKITESILRTASFCACSPSSLISRNVNYNAPPLRSIPISMPAPVGSVCLCLAAVRHPIHRTPSKMGSSDKIKVDFL